MTGLANPFRIQMIMVEGSLLTVELIKTGVNHHLLEHGSPFSNRLHRAVHLIYQKKINSVFAVCLDMKRT